jgi:hypothetical protein
MVATSLSISLTVNTIVTGLIVLRILKVYWKGRSAFDQTLGVGRDHLKLRSIIFIIIESGMAMFSIQLIRVVLTILELDATYFIMGIHQMFNVIIRSVLFYHLTLPKFISRE